MQPLRSRLPGLAAILALCAATPALAETFTYDALGRLTGITTSGGTTTYQYDRADNWTAVSSSRQASRKPSSSASQLPPGARSCPSGGGRSAVTVVADSPPRSAGTGLHPRRPDVRPLTRPVSGGARRLAGSSSR